MIQVRRFAPYLLVVACVIANGLQLRATIEAYVQPNALVQAWEDQTRSIRDALPGDIYVASYLENSDLAEIAAPDDPNRFSLSQYALAPRVLMPGLGQEWMVANFRGVPIRFIRSALHLRLGKFIMRYFGSGFYLIHDIGD